MDANFTNFYYDYAHQRVMFDADVQVNDPVYAPQGYLQAFDVCPIPISMEWNLGPAESSMAQNAPASTPSLIYGPYHAVNSAAYPPALAQGNAAHAQRPTNIVQTVQLAASDHLAPSFGGPALVGQSTAAPTPSLLVPFKESNVPVFMNFPQPAPLLATPVRPTASCSPSSALAPSPVPATPQYTLTPSFSPHDSDLSIVPTPNLSQNSHLGDLAPDAVIVHAQLGERLRKPVSTSGDPTVADSMLFSSDVPKSVLFEPVAFAHWGTGCASIQPIVHLDSPPQVAPPEVPVVTGVASLAAVPDKGRLIDEGINEFCTKSFPENSALQAELGRIMVSPWHPNRKEDLAAFLETSFIGKEKRWNCRFSSDHGLCKGSFKRRDTALSHILGTHVRMLPFECGGECGDINCTRRFPSGAAKNSHLRRGSSICERCRYPTSVRNISRHMQTAKCRQRAMLLGAQDLGTGDSYRASPKRR